MYVGPTPQSRGQLNEVLVRIFFSAPNNFKQPSNMWPGEEITLEGSVEQLRLGILHVFRAPRHQESGQRMMVVLNEIYEKFRSGDVSGGRIQCHELRDLISKAPR